MSKALKTIAIVAAALLAVGILMVSVTLVLGVDVTHLFGAINHEDGFFMDEKMEKELQEFETLMVDVNYQKIVLKEGDAFHIAYSYDSKYSCVSHEIKDGSLIVTEERKKKVGFSNDLLNLIGEKEGGGIIEITYPKKTVFRDIRIVSDMGEINAKDFSVNNLQVDLGLGSIDIENVHAQTLQVHAAAGDVSLFDGSADRAELELNLGSLKAKKWKTNGLVAELNSGEAKLNGIFLGETDVTCDLGSVKLELEDLKERYSYELGVNLGSIIVDGTKTKKNSVLQGTGENRLNVRAAMGDVELTFHLTKEES